MCGHRVATVVDSASVSIGIEHRINDAILIEAAFAQRLSHRTTPELARLDPLEIHRRSDASSEDRNHLAISLNGREVLRGAIRVDEIAGSRIFPVDPTRAFRGFQCNQTLSLRRPFEAERIEPAR